jgi:hypothetical protein
MGSWLAHVEDEGGCGSKANSVYRELHVAATQFESLFYPSVYLPVAFVKPASDLWKRRV